MKSVIALLAFAAVAQAGLLAQAPVYQTAYAAPLVTKAILPAAQSHQYNNRAPAARVAIAAPVYGAVAHHAVAAPVYGAVAHHAVAPVATYGAVGHYAHASPVVAAPAYHAAPVHHAVVHQSFSTPFASYAW